MIEQSMVIVAVGIVLEVFKRVTENQYNRIVPLFALVLGIVGQVFLYLQGDIIENVFNGILIGGATAGIYDVVTKSLINKE